MINKLNAISLDDFLRIQMITYLDIDVRNEKLINFLDTKAFLQYLIDTDNIKKSYSVSIDEILACENLLF